MIPRLSPAYLAAPFAHRGLHDLSKARPENSMSAFQAAIDHGYGIELDIQMSADGEAIVFHDYALDRLTGRSGAVRQHSSAELTAIRLNDGSGDMIPTLKAVLDHVKGQVPLLLEIKDQDGALGPDVGALEAAIADQLAEYPGEAAVMSFNPHSVSAMQTLAPDRPRGLVTEGFHNTHHVVPEDRLHLLSRIVDYDRVGAAFISHKLDALQMPRVAELQSQGAVIFCWTVKTSAQATEALRIADNITFEGFLPA